LSGRVSYAIAVVILLLATGLRLWDFTTLPAGVSDEELRHVMLMRDEILRGNIRVFYEVEGGEGQEGTYHMLLALSTIIFGTGTIGLRIPSLLAGIGAVAIMYSLGVRLYGRVAGLAAMGLIAVMLWATLLSRLILVEALLPLLITAVMLSLARTMPVYSRNRPEATNTQDFAVLGLLLGLSLYVHPSGLMVVLTAMVFIAYVIILRRPLSLRWLSYIGFAILMLLIVAIPYLLSTIRLPALDAGERIIGNYGSITLSLLDGVTGLMLDGDTSALHNLPHRALIDPISGFFVLLGVVACVHKWREPRFGLVLIAGVLLAPPALLADASPNFRAYSVLLPVVALWFGLGLSLFLLALPRSSRAVMAVAVVGLLGVNLYWTGQDLFVNWVQEEDVQIAYNANIGQIAHHLDQTASALPTVLCYPNWDVPHQPNTPLSPAQQILLLLNNDSAPIRYVDCRAGLLFTDGGVRQQVVVPTSEIFDQVPPIVADWLSLGTPITTLPERSVIVMDVQTELADALGVYQTTTPASYETIAELPERVPIPPPIRLGGNLTWLGYDTDPFPMYPPLGVVPVTTYWRVEGIVPPDTRIFTHILSDPVTLVANRDMIAVNPVQLQERDVFIHVVNVPLRNVLPGIYEVSVGGYRSSADVRLEVFANEGEVRGDRIFLYGIEVIAPE
jgi:4-amino-4-deoxy-L-arabinose transferase-like glycosyltransferase